MQPDVGRVANQKWRNALSTCFVQRHQPSLVGKALSKLYQTQPIPPAQLAETLLTIADDSYHAADPLLKQYLVFALDSNLLTTPDILSALLLNSSFAVHEQSRHKAVSRHVVSPAVLRNVLDMLGQYCRTIDESPNQNESWQLLSVLRQWWTACIAQKDADDHDASSLVEIGSNLGSVAQMTVHVLTCDAVKSVLIGHLNAKARSMVTTELTDFIALLTHWAPLSKSIPLLLHIKKSPPLLAMTHSDIQSLSYDEISDSIPDLPFSMTRAGLYAYMNAALSSPSSTEDDVLFAHVIRHGANQYAAVIVDLIVASFDTYRNSCSRGEIDHRTYCRSFIVNKLPLMLKALETQLEPPQTLQDCVQVALGRIDVQAYPALMGHMINNTDDALRSARRDFVLALTLQQCTSNTFALQTTGESVKVGRYTIADLLSQCTNKSTRILELVGELSLFSGNVAVISLAVVDQLQMMSERRDLGALKSIAQVLCRNLVNADIMLQHVSMAALMTPLINVVNEWNFEPDNSELQPVFEEYATILLLTLALVHRYSLQNSDLLAGTRRDTFLAKLMQSNVKAQSQLTDEENKHLSVWLKGLYATDEQGETSGIGDEILSQCSPQDFFLLAPTLFSQSVIACRSGRLALKTFLGGLEFLLEPFLLPALVGILSWTADQPWTHRGNPDIIFKALDRLLRPPSTSGDGAALHAVMLTTVARPLLATLENLSQAGVHSKEIITLIEILRSNTLIHSTNEGSIHEIRSWTVGSAGLQETLCNVIRQLVAWTSQFGMTNSPPQYTHRLFTTALDILGAEQVLSAFVDVIVEQTLLGSGPAAIEMTSALICAPCMSTLRADHIDSKVGNGNKDCMQAVRRALSSCLSDTRELLARDVKAAEAIVRLGRRVEAQCAPSMTSLPKIVLPEQGTSATSDAAIVAASMDDAQAIVDKALTMTAAEAVTADLVMNLDDPAALANVMSKDVTAMTGADAMQLDIPNTFFDAPAQTIDFGIAGPLSATVQAAPAAQQPLADMLMSGAITGTAETINEDDIFAGLDFGGTVGDDEFNF